VDMYLHSPVCLHGNFTFFYFDLCLPGDSYRNLLYLFHIAALTIGVIARELFTGLWDVIKIALLTVVCPDLNSRHGCVCSYSQGTLSFTVLSGIVGVPQRGGVELRTPRRDVLSSHISVKLP
jgi:hypothetical protein